MKKKGYTEIHEEGTERHRERYGGFSILAIKALAADLR